MDQPLAGCSAPNKQRGPTAAGFWNRQARRYAATPVADPGAFETTLSRTAARLSSEHAVLEVGCGTGTAALRLASGTRSYLATDCASEMIAIARARLAVRPQVPLRFDVAPADAAPLAGRCHDRVLAFNLLHLVSDLDATLGALRRALKPGGLLISKTICLSEMSPLVSRTVVPLLGLVGRAPPMLRFDAARLRGAIEGQGFIVEAAERHGSRSRDHRIFIVARKS